MLRVRKARVRSQVAAAGPAWLLQRMRIAPGLGLGLGADLVVALAEALDEARAWVAVWAGGGRDEGRRLSIWSRIGRSG